MEIPASFDIIDNKLTPVNKAASNPNKQCTTPAQNMYRLKQMGSKQGGNVLIYIRSDCVLLLYIDDCLLFSLKVAILDSILAHLDKVFNITIKHDVSAYLDLDVSHNTDNHSTISHFSWWTQKQIQ